MKITAIGFIGLGLIGGSIARGLRKIHPEYRMIATSHTSATLEEALCAGVIDEAVPCLNAVSYTHLTLPTKLEV